MRIAVTYDLRKDYLALGYSEEKRIEYCDPPKWNK